MNSDERLIHDAYTAFNRRDADAALATLHSDVMWADGEGRLLRGHEEVRKHWMEQWAKSAPTIELIGFSRRGPETVTADIRIVIRDARDDVMSDRRIKNVFAFQAGLIKRMEIPD